MKGLQIQLVYMPADVEMCANIEELIDPIADYLVGLELWGSFRVLEYDEEGTTVGLGILKETRKKTGRGLFGRKSCPNCDSDLGQTCRKCRPVRMA